MNTEPNVINVLMVDYTRRFWTVGLIFTDQF